MNYVSTGLSKRKVAKLRVCYDTTLLEKEKGGIEALAVAAECDRQGGHIYLSTN